MGFDVNGLQEEKSIDDGSDGFETLAFMKALCSCYNEGLLKAHEIDREMNLHEVRGKKWMFLQVNVEREQ